MKLWFTVNSQSHSYKHVRLEVRPTFKWGSSLRVDQFKYMFWSGLESRSSFQDWLSYMSLSSTLLVWVSTLIRWSTRSIRTVSSHSDCIVITAFLIKAVTSKICRYSGDQWVMSSSLTTVQMLIISTRRTPFPSSVGMMTLTINVSLKCCLFLKHSHRLMT